MRHISRRVFIGGLALAGAVPAAAQDFPSRPVTLIVPFAPGGATDITARGIAPIMAEKLGQPVVVENVSGGGTLIAAGRVVQAVPDGYTLLLHNIAISAIPSLYPNLRFDLQKDLRPIGLVNNNPLVVVGRKSLPPDTLSELRTWMKNNTAKFAYVGAGSSGHLITVLFAQALGVAVDYIPYRGAGPALQDIIGGHVDLFFTTPNVLIAPINSGAVKGYGVTSKNLVAQFPQVPSLVQELGPKMEIQFWHGLFAPSATPMPIIDKLNATLRQALDDPKLVQAWAASGVAAFPSEQRTQAAADAYFRSEVKRWGEVIRENRIEPPKQ